MKAHRTDGVSLTFALIFLAVLAWWLFAQFNRLTLPAVGWLLASALIAIGVLGLVGALRANRSGRRQATRPEATTTGEPSVPSTMSETDISRSDADIATLGSDTSTLDVDTSTLGADVFRPGAVDAPTREFDRPGADEPTARLFGRPIADDPDRGGEGRP